MSGLHFDGPPDNLIVWSGPDERVCFMAHSNGADPERDIARAALVTAAPDLHTALLEAHRALQFYEWYNNPQAPWRAASDVALRERVDAALAKACPSKRFCAECDFSVFDQDVSVCPNCEGSVA